MSSEEFFKKISESHPFITVCTYADQDYVGIIQNRDDAVTTLYDYGAITDAQLKLRFLELGDIWWWESNRMWPINIFLKEDWMPFRDYLKTFTTKGLNIIHGPSVSMSDLSKTRTKKRSVMFVKRLNK